MCFRRGGRVAIAVATIHPLDRGKRPSRHLAGGKHGAHRDASQRTDLGAGYHASCSFPRSGTSTPTDSLEASLPWKGWSSVRGSLEGRESRAPGEADSHFL